jgi:hypothetical protein
MNKKHNRNCIYSLLILVTLFPGAYGQNPDQYKYSGSFDPAKSEIITRFQFNGYTNYWHDIRHDWVHYGNLFKIAHPDADYTIAQSKRDIADDMQIPRSLHGRGLHKRPAQHKLRCTRSA